MAKHNKITADMVLENYNSYAERRDLPTYSNPKDMFTCLYIKIGSIFELANFLGYSIPTIRDLFKEAEIPFRIYNHKGNKVFYDSTVFKSDQEFYELIKIFRREYKLTKKNDPTRNQGK